MTTSEFEAVAALLGAVEVAGSVVGCAVLEIGGELVDALE